MRLTVLSLLTTCFMVNLYRVFGCTVTPAAAAIFTGTNISVACIPASGESVGGWRRQNGERTLYWGGPYRSVAYGYSVDDSNTSKIILTLTNVSVQYADNYECTCNSPTAPASSGYTNITVIDSEPQFVAVDSLSSDDQVKFTCSLKLAGNACVFMKITNSRGQVFAELEGISANFLQQFNLYYNTSSAIETLYICKISLANDGSDQKTTIFSRSLTSTVQFSARSVSISPENPEHCQNGGFCEKNSVINCTASGSPEPSYNFTIYQNGTLVRFLPNQQKYTTAYVGQQFIQCTAFNEINGVLYSNSITFTTNVSVTEASIVPHNNDSNIPLIVGLVVGLGGGLLLIIIIVVIIYYKRQKIEVHKGNEEVYTHPQVPQSPNEREHAYTGINLSRDAQDTDAHNDRPTTESYDYVI